MNPLSPSLRRRRISLKSTFILNEYLLRYYKELDEAEDNGKKIASASLGFPGEILWPFDVIPIYPQNHAALYATYGQARDVLEDMEGKGYLTDICSEVKIAFGTLLHEHQLPYRLPKPDMALAATNVCRSMAKFGEHISAVLNLPFFLLDIPFLQGDVSPSKHQCYIVEQLEELMAFLATQTNITPEPGEINKAMELADKAALLWHDILALCANIPAPADALDLYVHMFPIVTLRGKKAAVEYYEILKDELANRVDKGIGAIPNEKYRLLWDYLPIYHKTNFFSEMFADRKIAIVTSTFFFPLGSIARRNHHAVRQTTKPDLQKLAMDFIHLYPNFSLRQKLNTIKEIVSTFKIDGVVMHCDRSCKPQSLMQYQLRNFIEKEIRIPCLIIDSDSVDPRFFSEEQIITRVEAFLECLSESVF